MSSAVITPNRKINPLLAAYLNQLAKKPLLTKSVTAAILNLLQEYTATHLSVSKPLPLTAGLDLKALKLSAYGFFISAPLAHLLFGRLQKMFAGKTGSAAKLGMLVASNLLAVPIQSAVYVASLAIINGAKSSQDIIRAFRSAYWFLIKTTWVANTASITLAQNLLPPEAWVPFFNLVTFALGTYFNTQMKKAKLKAEAKQKEKEREREEKKD